MDVGGENCGQFALYGSHSGTILHSAAILAAPDATG